MRRLLLVLAATGLTAGVPASPASAGGLVGPVASVSPLTEAPLGAPQVASNAKGDTVVAWLDPASDRVVVSERPVGGTYTTGAAIGAPDAVLGSVGIDKAGTIHVFVIADASAPAAAAPYVATKAVGAADWTLTQLAAADAAKPLTGTISGAVAYNGAAIATWAQGDAGDPAAATIQYARKFGGNAAWSAKAAVPGATGPTADYDLDVTEFGDAAFVFTQPGCPGGRERASAATLTDSGIWGIANGLSSCDGTDETQGRPSVAFGPGGYVVAAWLRTAGPSARIVQSSSARVGTGPWATAPASGAADLSAAGEAAGQPALAVAPDGTAAVAWTVGQKIQERTRPPGGTAFATATTIPAAGSDPTDLRLVAGAEARFVALWTSTAVLAPTPGPAPIMGVAVRTQHAPTFSPLSGAAGRSVLPELASDDQGNFGVAWIEPNADGSRRRVQATGLDFAPPTLGPVTFPATAIAQTPFAFAATAVDRWSTPTVEWAFGDATQGPAGGTKAYARAGTFTAAVTAYDAVGNSVTVPRQIAVGPGPHTAPSPTPTPGPPVRVVAPFKLTLPKAKRTVKLTKKGEVDLGTISCPATARSCPAAKATLKPVSRGKGRKRLPATLGRKAFTAKPGKSVKLRLKLAKKLTATLRARTSVPVRVTVTASGAKTRSVTVTLKRG